MIRLVTLSIVAALTLSLALGGLAGAFGGVALLVVGVAGFGLLIGLCTDLLRET
ncbi:MAG: hypothetical protein H7X89_00840 [Rhizobiales bacterium]|nr:hypothetical protein [Hyphomicrobiales bacterium]